MSITAYNVERLENVSEVTVTSSLSGTIYFHWWLDGLYQGASTSASRAFFTDVAQQARIEVVDSNDADFDWAANAPAAYPPRRSLWWVRSLDSDVAHYKIEQQQDGGDWETLGYVTHRRETWSYFFTTDRLDDLAEYSWRVTPIDAAGNAGTAVTIDSEKIVRTPDAPSFAVAFDEGTSRVEFSG